MSDLLFFVPITTANSQENWVQISCFTENKLSLDFLGLSFIAHENDSILLLGSTQFEAIGSSPILKFTIDSSGRAASALSGVLTSDVAFFMVNGSRDYYIGPYYEQFSVNATTENGIVNYEINLTSSIEEARNAIPSEGTIEDIGIRGRLTFEVKIRASIGIIGQKRFLSVLLQGLANLNVIACDFTIPKEAELKEAINGNQDMQKRSVPYRVDTSVGVKPLEPFGANLYLEWEMPEGVPLLIRIIYDPIFLTVIGIIAGAIIGRYPWFWLDERRQKKQFVKKLIMELEDIEKNIRENRPLDTTIYDSLTPKLLLLSDKTSGIVKNTYDEIKRTQNIGYTSLQRDINEQIIDKIIMAISTLKNEIA